MTGMNFKLFLINVCTIVSDSYYTITGKIKNFYDKKHLAGHDYNSDLCVYNRFLNGRFSIFQFWHILN